MLRAFVAASCLVLATAQCPGVQVVQLPYGNEAFESITLPSLHDALNVETVAHAVTQAGGDAPMAWRVIAGWEVQSYDTVRVTAIDDDTSVAWTCAITDGGGEFVNFGGQMSSAAIPGGTYAIVCDVVTVPQSSTPPKLITRSYVPEWMSCPAVIPMPSCSLTEGLQKYSQFADGAANQVTFTATIAAGFAR